MSALVESLVQPEPGPSMRACRAAVLGCGSVGGLVAWHLASAGIGCLTLADRDILGPENLRRHVCGHSELRRPKAPAVARFLQARFPTLALAAQTTCLRTDLERARSLLAGADLGIVAVDDEGLKHLLDALAHQTATPLVFAGVYGGGWAVEVVLVDPVAGTPCYACAARSLGRVGIDLVGNSSPPYTARTPANPSSWEAADLSSIAPAATLAARVATARLLHGIGSSAMWHELTRSGASAWRLALREVPAWNLGPWQLQPVVVPRFAGCPVCAGTTPTITLRDIIDEGVLS
jgi:hypothetical protein